MNDRPNVLVADDQQDVLHAIRLLLKENYEVATVNSPGAVLRALERTVFDLLMIDLNYTRDTTSASEGLELLSHVHAWDSALPIVVMTAWGSIDIAVEAMKRGARDFVQKPWENERLQAIVSTQVELGRALRHGQRLEIENRILRDERYPSLIAQSPVMRPVLEMIDRIGPSEANILITGENGTGKGVVARALHAISRRASRPLVSVNVGGLSEGIFESELFGHIRGAFTDAKSDRVGRFELADGGTLFLDEIANIPPGQQAKLLRVIETGEFERVGSSQTRHADVRLISATNAVLEDEVNAGRFRQDLLFRLKTVEIRLPPLRERRQDIALFAGHFLTLQARRYRKEISGFDDAAMNALLEHSWRGNVRELEHAVERAVLMAGGRTIRKSDLGLQAPVESEPRLEALSLEDVEAVLIRKALARFGGNVSKVAETLGLSRSALYRRIQRYGL